MRGVPFLRFRGVVVEAHWSLGLLALNEVLISAYFLPVLFRDLSSWWVAILALALAGAYLGSILLHEFGHSFQARREGQSAERITLWGLGGIAWIRGPVRSAGADFRVVAAGPLVTLTLFLLSGGLAGLSHTGGLGDPAVAFFAFFAVIQLSVLLFNLLPVFPLDGGQMLYATVWRLRDTATAARWTTRIGFAVAFAVLVFGIVGPFVAVIDPPFDLGGADPFTRSLVTSVGFMVTGVLLLRALTLFEPPSHVRTAALRGWQVGDLLRPEPVVVSPETTTAAFVDRLPRARGYTAGVYPVVDGGEVVGIVSPGLAVEAIDRGHGEQSIEVTMLRKGEAVVLTPEMSMEDGFAAFGEGQTSAVILDRGRVLGIVRRADLARALLEANESPHGSIVPVTPAPVRVSW